MFGIRVRAHGPSGGATPPGQAAPAGSDIGPALLPVPAVFAAAWQSNGQIHGAAGTQRVDAPAPQRGLDLSPVAQATTGRFAGSTAVPYWYPQLWYQTDIPATIPVVTLGNPHMFPVPAIRPNNIMVTRGTNSPGGISPSDGAFAARMGGRWPIGWPKVIANYPA